MSNKKTVTFIRGLAGVGKTTLADDMVGQKTSVVERDTFRHAFNISNEKEITRLQRETISAHLKDGNLDKVIVSDTNLNPKFYKQFTEWATGQGFHVDEIDLRGGTPVEALDAMHKAIKQDLKRERHVGERVIRNQFFNFIAPLFHYEGDHDGEPFIVADLDGTLISDFSQRSPYDTTSKILEDVPNEYLVYQLTCAVQDMGIRVLFFTGRKQAAFKYTYQWLCNLFDDKDFELFMRSDDDNRKDYIVKYEMFQDTVAAVGGNVLAVYDDRPQVNDLYLTLGLPLYSLSKGVWF